MTGWRSGERQSKKEELFCERPSLLLINAFGVKSGEHIGKLPLRFIRAGDTPRSGSVGPVQECT